MSSFAELVVLSAMMGLSIFLSLPIILRKAMGSRTIAVLNAAAIGILVFLVADVYANASAIMFPAGYIGAEVPVAIFTIGFLSSFLLLFFLGRPSDGPGVASPNGLALIIAVAIALQNLTEGLVFGAAWALGITGLLVVIFVGFFLQNVTEGFPIAAPYLGFDRPPIARLAGYFVLGGMPTLLGSVVGFYWNSANLDVLFDALAIGAIVYALLPMVKAAFRGAATPGESRMRQDLVYLGLAAGFAVGFLVNAL
jgi:zinc transporter, ZIP family